MDRLSSYTSQFGQFLAWWGQELAEMLPGWLTETAADAGPAHVVCVDRDGLRLLAANPPAASDDANAGRLVEGRPVQTAAEIAAQVAGIAGTKGENVVGLRIPSGYCFNRLVELPSAAEKDFSRLLALDMERATPFRASDVYTAFLLVPQAVARPGKTTVRQIIVKRSLLTGALAELEAAGLRVGRIDAWDETGRTPLKIDLRGAGASGRASERSLLRPIAAAGVVAASLAAWSGYATLTNLKASLARLDTQAEELRVRVASQRASKEAAKAAQSTLMALDTLVTSPPSKLDVVEELTQIVPDSAWVNDLRITSDGVDISGFAKSTVALLPLLERSPKFKDATSAAAVTFDPREDKERFSLHVRYRTPPSTLAQATGDHR